MKYTIEEKKFMAEYCPKVKIEKAQVYCYWTGDSMPLPTYFFWTEDAVNADPENAFGIELVLTIKDEGPDLGPKLVWFEDFAQIYHNCGENDFQLDIVPSEVRILDADEDGRFEVAVPMIFKDASDESIDGDVLEELYEKLKKDEAEILINRMFVGNQFAHIEFDGVATHMTSDEEGAPVHYDYRWLGLNGKYEETEGKAEDNSEPQPISDIILTLRSGKRQVHGKYISENEFVVLKGSELKRSQANTLNGRISRIREELINSDKVCDFVTTEDITFEDSSIAAQVFLGYNVYGPVFWTTSDGRELESILR